MVGILVSFWDGLFSGGYVSLRGCNLPVAVVNEGLEGSHPKNANIPGAVILGGRSKVYIILIHTVDG